MGGGDICHSRKILTCLQRGISTVKSRYSDQPKFRPLCLKSYLRGLNSLSFSSYSAQRFRNFLSNCPKLVFRPLLGRHTADLNIEILLFLQERLFKQKNLGKRNLSTELAPRHTSRHVLKSDQSMHVRLSSGAGISNIIQHLQANLGQTYHHYYCSSHWLVGIRPLWL